MEIRGQQRTVTMERLKPAYILFNTDHTVEDARPSALPRYVTRSCGTVRFRVNPTIMRSILVGLTCGTQPNRGYQNRPPYLNQLRTRGEYYGSHYHQSPWHRVVTSYLCSNLMEFCNYNLCYTRTIYILFFSCV
ncbi:hypothetical protein AVEN_3813-1 [Araneus ventricosus]|uniref:Uncharacterized protein n=1 Tax=Araneus ventricosus TaxID=182803 RepID=A0A4Y2HE38_ARAVE|nr:hypothetical protein AVEN_3813-1 [Araneus ventricosus]